jgi:hypothetical protein
MERLLQRASRRLADPDLYAGIVHACRYCGLLDASVAAYNHARRLDPAVTTSVVHTFWMLGDYERAMAVDHDTPRYMTTLSLLAQGRTDQARTSVLSEVPPASPMGPLIRAIQAALTGRAAEAAELVRGLRRTPFRDPEGWFYWAVVLAASDAHEEAMDLIRASIEGGFHQPLVLETLPLFAPLREMPGFAGLLDTARQGRSAAAAAFVSGGGPEILGVRED